MSLAREFTPGDRIVITYLDNYTHAEVVSQRRGWVTYRVLYIDQTKGGDRPGDPRDERYAGMEVEGAVEFIRAEGDPPAPSTFPWL